MAVMVKTGTAAIPAAPVVPAAGAAGAPATATTVAGSGKITTKPVTRAEGIYYVIAYAALVVGAIVGILAARHWHLSGTNKNVFAPAAGVTIFAALYVVTQALERLLEPVATLYGQTTAPAANEVEAGAGVDAADMTAKVGKLRLLSKETATRLRNSELAAAEKAADPVDAAKALNRAATWQQILDQVASNRATLWAVASGLGMAISGATGLFLLHAIDKGKWDIPRWLDVIATGLIIGGGTKPLHDLITNLQAAKDDKKTPAQATAQSPPGSG
jgi:hypothetical protein